MDQILALFTGPNTVLVAFFGFLGVTGAALFPFLASRGRNAIDGKKVELDAIAASRAELNGRFDALIDDMRAERAEMRATIKEQSDRMDAQGERLREQSSKISLLTRTVEEMKGYIATLSRVIRDAGREVPKPPQEW